MKKIITMSIAAGLVAVASAEVSVTMDLASAYVFRGVTLLDGASFQPGIEASGLGLPEEYGAVAVGAWGAADLDDANGTANTFQEIDWYVAYSLPALIEGVDLALGYCEYAYGAGFSDKEFSIGAGWEYEGVGLGATYYQGVGGLIGTSSYAELTAGFGIDISEDIAGSVDASVGYADPASGKSGFADYSIGVSAGYALSEQWSAGVSVTYIGQIDDEVLPDGPYDVDFVGMFSLACDM